MFDEETFYANTDYICRKPGTDEIIVLQAGRDAFLGGTLLLGRCDGEPLQIHTVRVQTCISRMSDDVWVTDVGTFTVVTPYAPPFRLQMLWNGELYEPVDFRQYTITRAGDTLVVRPNLARMQADSQSVFTTQEA